MRGASRWLGKTLAGARRWLERRPVLVALVASLLAVEVVVLLAGAVGFARLNAILDQPHDFLWLLVCAAGELAAYLGYVLALQAISAVGGGPGLGFRASLTAVVAGFGVVSAARSSGGFAVDYWVLRHAGLGERPALIRVLALGALEYATLAPVALACALVAYARGAPPELTLPWLAAAPGFALAVLLTRRRERRPEPDAPRLRGALSRGAAVAVSALRLLRSLLTRSRRQGQGLVGALLYWAGDIACLWGALSLVDVSIDVPRLVVAYATGYVLTRRSLPVGGAGIVELALTIALTWFGVDLGRALVAVVVYRFFNFWLPMLPAVLALPEIEQMRARYRRAREDVPVDGP